MCVCVCVCVCEWQYVMCLLDHGSYSCIYMKVFKVYAYLNNCKILGEWL